MGCGGSKEFETVYTDYPKLKMWQEGFEKLGLCEKEVGKFYEKFLQYKIDAENRCRIKEIVFHMHCHGGHFMTKYWNSVAKSADSGYVTFQEYVLGFWNLLSLRPLQKTYDKFTFDLYVETKGRNKGSISCNKAKDILDDIYGDKKDFIYKKAVKHLLDPKSPSFYTMAEWSAFTEANEGVLSPLQNLQKKERFKLFGHSYWEKKMDSRKKLSRGKSYLTLSETMTMHGISKEGSAGGGGGNVKLKPSAKDPLVRKSSSSSLSKGGMSSKSHSQATLLQGGSCNSINVDG